MNDHTAHVELFFDLWLTLARAQLTAMQTLYGDEACGPHADTIRVVQGQIDLVESKMKTVQTRDVEPPQL